MQKQKNIRLFWWSEIYLAHKKEENYGDLIGKYLVEKISNKKIIWSHPKKRNFWNHYQTIFFTVGSILTQVKGKCVVWGSGIISKEFKINKAQFLVVRGPQTRKLLLEQGHEVPEIYGDPALLMPRFYNPQREIKYGLGIVPHYVDYEKVYSQYKDVKEVLVINLMTNDIEEVTDSILSCEKIISSSLHGIIVAHAYQIPAVWVEFSNKIFGDGIKYRDYFESVEIDMYRPLFLENPINNDQLGIIFSSNKTFPKKERIMQIQKQLMEVCPFK
jgi:pyruvyltransferase